MVEKINARFIIQIAGKPEENVIKALEHIKTKLKEEKDLFKVIEIDLDKPELDEETTLYVGMIEVLARFNSTHDVMNFILDYTPISIQVEEPERLELNNSEFSNILNDMTSFILAYQNEIRKLKAQVHILNNQLNKK